MSAARYRTSAGIEGQYEPGSRNRVLRNLRGINSKQTMDETEFEALVEVQESYLDRVNKDTTFTARFLCQMHADWLGSIYEWAGNYRTVEMSKSGFTWPPAFRVHANMESFEAKLLTKLTPFRMSSMDDGWYDLARVHADLLLIHPFREGNGRMARWLTDLMCLQAGLPQLDYGFTGLGSRNRKITYLNGVIEGYDQNYRTLATVFREAFKRATT